MTRPLAKAVLATGVWLAGAVAAHGVVQRSAVVTQKTFRHDGLYVPELHQKVSELPAERLPAARRDLQRFGIADTEGFFDSRAGRWSSLILSEPLIPGSGAGNALQWSDLGLARAPEAGALKEQVWNSLYAYLVRRQAELRLPFSELGAPRVTVLERGNLIYVYVPRVSGNLRVRDNSLNAVINHGNLVLLGLQNWGDVASVSGPQISDEEARSVARQHAAPYEARFTKAAALELIPMAEGEKISYRLVWALHARLDGDVGNWEALIDAGTGELIAFEDRNQYAQRQVVGGAYPVSNDQRPPDGQEQVGWPMPYANVVVGGETIFTDSGGNAGCATGSISTSLSGLYVQITDTCGSVNESSAGNLDLGSGPAASSTNCTVPVGHSAGDTKSARTGFYELNRLIEQARGHHPDNTWLNSQLNANMNIIDTCNAFWDGGSVNFFRSGGGCRNTGEQAAIFDHEWGHGFDNNGANPTVSTPGESIADIHALLRLNTSCIGRGFFINSTCGGYGDPCNGTPADGCTGVRDVDWANHECNLPHTVSWITGGFSAGQCPGSAPPCPSEGSRGPCNRETHCEGQIVAEAAWDLQLRDLRAAPYNYDLNTALEITTRLFMLAGQPVTSWYTCAVGGGCGASGGYLNVLAADDDNGTLSDGTPHMEAIFAAFERHEIHCATPAVVDSGCAGAPAAAPAVVGTGLDTGASLTWSAVPGATRYLVFRTDGVSDCDFGKIKIGETDGLSFLDGGLQNGREYYYTVMPASANACFGPMSSCTTVVPIAGPNLGIRASSELDLAGGDGDAFLDNCELGTLTFTVENTGAGTLTNVRVTDIEAVSHPFTTIQTSVPFNLAPSLDECATAEGAFSFVPQGLTFADVTEFAVTITADELAGDTRVRVLRVLNTETDAVHVDSRTWSFEADLEGWTVVAGSFTRQPGGAGGTSFHLSSSSNLDNACDQVRSPGIVLNAGSTLQLANRYAIESPIPDPYDRANVGIFEILSGARTTVEPTSGRLYEIDPGEPNGVCVTANEAGWAGTQATFGNSAFNATSLTAGGSLVGLPVRLDIAYGTDVSVAGTGFDFDEVTLTDFQELVADEQSNACVAEQAAPEAIVVDGAGNGVLEPNETAVVQTAWRNTGIAPLALTGAADNFTGPAGPTYGIPDAAADFGTIGVGTAEACADCYTLEITSAARPVQHWDATFDETVTPTSSEKTWSLHVGESFADVPTSNIFYRFIETIFHNGVTGGCAVLDSYCPTDSTLRKQMAVFLLKASEGADYIPPAATGIFDDVPADGFQPWIEDLYNRGITGGCLGGPPPAAISYCPDQPVKRKQMAVFLLKTKEGSSYTPPAAAGIFDDVPADVFQAWIEELYNRGVTGGCSGGPPPAPISFCPENSVTRAQMATFVSLTFEMLLYRP